MHTIRIPKIINFGENALSETEYPKNALVVKDKSKNYQNMNEFLL